MNSVNKILLRRKNALFFKQTEYKSDDDSSIKKTMIVEIIKNIEEYGFTLSCDLIRILMTFDKKIIISFYQDLIIEIKLLTGADKVYNPMYPNFPKQVVAMDDIELFFNAMIHYISFGEIKPEYEKDTRLPLIDSTKLKVIDLADDDCALSIFNCLIQSKTSLSQQDKEDLKTLLCTERFYQFLPSEIPFKETVVYVSKCIIEDEALTTEAKKTYIEKYYKTATDVLRLLTALSNGDISLTTNTEFKNIPRWQRRLILSLLENCTNAKEDMFRYQHKWIRAGEVLHPFEKKISKSPYIRELFNTIRNDKRPILFGTKTEKSIKEGDIKTAVEILMQRPGEFARRLDKLLRMTEGKYEEQCHIIDKFGKVAYKVATPVLLQVRQHFINREKNDNEFRVFFPKGNTATNFVAENNLPRVNPMICKFIENICERALCYNYHKRDFMGNVYIDDSMRNYVIPYSQRSASKANKIITRGSRIPINADAKIVRAYIWWTNTKEGERIDLDLSAGVFDENWNYISHISYSTLKNKTLKMYHSGDIVDGGNYDGDGVAEFIDIDIDEANKNNVRYVVFQVYSFIGIPYSQIEHCRFGWMERSDAEFGEIFEPKTVKINMNLTGSTPISIPVIFDCKEKQFIWCDMSTRVQISCGNRYLYNVNLESNLHGVISACYGIVTSNKPTMYDAILLNTASRGQRVYDKAEANIIFDINDCRASPEQEIITPFDTEYFMRNII